MTIQLDVKALLALIEMCGGEPFVLELRKGVMQAAFQKYAKALVDARANAVTQQMVQDEIRKQIGQVNSWPHNLEINPKLHQAIKQEIDNLVLKATGDYRQMARDAAQAAIDATDIKRIVDSRVSAELREEVNRQVKVKLEAALAAMKGAL